MQILPTQAAGPVDHRHAVPTTNPNKDSDFGTVMRQKEAKASDQIATKRTVDELREEIASIRNFEIKLTDQLKDLDAKIDALRNSLKSAKGEIAESLTRQLNALMELKEQLLKEIALAQAEKVEKTENLDGLHLTGESHQTLLAPFGLRPQAEDLDQVMPQVVPAPSLEQPDTWKTRNQNQI
ncbi:MAG: hypothetical protein ACRBB0_00410 [Pelagimonas sp.]|uniref:hypothetical protein n=1 Tax=Pelagimonas sp. TaxID=2073170 RepID=UPI003D6AE8A1